MPTEKATQLRASCERCRAQKVRCFPSSSPDQRAPCQRCVKIKAEDSCIFRSRSSARRSRDSKDLPTTGFQGKAPELTAVSVSPETSRISLRSLCSGGCSAKAPGTGWSYSATTSRDTTLDELDNITSVSTDFITKDWNDDLQEWNFSQPPWDESAFVDSLDLIMSGGTLPSNAQTSLALDEPTETFTHSASSLSSYPSPTTTNANENLSSSDTYLEARGAIDLNERPGESSELLVPLANILAEMYHYEQQLSRIATVSLPDYPIGDALYFSLRLYQILTPDPVSRHGRTLSTIGMPTVLLILSSLVTLMRIYSNITGYLSTSLLNGLKDREHHNRPADIGAYRGMRLAEVHKVCLCSSGGLAKSAVSRLLKTLADIEDLLDLPSGARATAIASKGFIPSLTPVSDHNSPVSLEAPMGVKTKMFHSTVGIQGEKLRKEVAQLMRIFEKIPSLGGFAGCGALSTNAFAKSPWPT
ncbi:hypothetical protein K491DRAFT_715452 [Lophiostoma macrostomum CBS 122681]|uniref:Zn(2)-C6 fungal-type domain-containing protein n=1 Tax=Lophiostoma macrostomum CBS 122681 TaxID=1314788 RepID=A0A6A6T8X0_9PLEO|nr:hypothetical protein K491DRAFT_715452 [Lophiostoma macrostomum CBS 122681]